VAEVVQPDQQVVRGGHVADYAHPTAALVGELGPLVKHMDARDLRSSNNEELLVRIGGQFFATFIL
jgi:hypothetical protein